MVLISTGAAPYPAEEGMSSRLVVAGAPMSAPLRLTAVPTPGNLPPQLTVAATTPIGQLRHHACVGWNARVGLQAAAALAPSPWWPRWVFSYFGHLEV